jgi:hypothetical protein
VKCEQPASHGVLQCLGICSTSCCSSHNTLAYAERKAEGIACHECQFVQLDVALGKTDRLDGMSDIGILIETTLLKGHFILKVGNWDASWADLSTCTICCLFATNSSLHLKRYTDPDPLQKSLHVCPLCLSDLEKVAQVDRQMFLSRNPSQSVPLV